MKMFLSSVSFWSVQCFCSYDMVKEQTIFGKKTNCWWFASILRQNCLKQTDGQKQEKKKTKKKDMTDIYVVNGVKSGADSIVGGATSQSLCLNGLQFLNV